MNKFNTIMTLCVPIYSIVKYFYKVTLNKGEIKIHELNT